MIFRKVLASFLVIIFVGLALLNFLIYGVSRTYLDSDFYRRNDVIEGVYGFSLNKVVTELRSDNDALAGFFTADELKTQIESVITKGVFAGLLNDISDQIDAYKLGETKTIKVNLRSFRENLITVVNNLVYIIYKELPTCSNLNTVFSVDKIPECVPPGVSYELVTRNVRENFEANIYSTIPEELSNIDQVLPLDLFVKVDGYRNLSFLALVICLSLIVLLIYSKLSTVVTYIGVAFGISGVLGFGLSMGLFSLVTNSNNVGDEETFKFIMFMFDFLVAEIQRLSIMFVLLGVTMFLIRLIVKRTVNEEKL